MLNRVQSQSGLFFREIGSGIRLHGAQRALAQWAIVDDYNHVLDLHCRDGRLLHSLAQKFSLRVCGIARDTASAKSLCATVPDAEIFCARKEDIPWRDESFDAVFDQVNKNDDSVEPASFREAFRVLKPNGQFLVALKGAPEAVSCACDILGIGEHSGHTSPRGLLRMMEAAGFADVSFRMAQPMVGIAMGWKRA